MHSITPGEIPFSCQKQVRSRLPKTQSLTVFTYDARNLNNLVSCHYWLNPPPAILNHFAVKSTLALGVLARLLQPVLWAPNCTVVLALLNSSSGSSGPPHSCSQKKTFKTRSLNYPGQRLFLRASRPCGSYYIYTINPVPVIAAPTSPQGGCTTQGGAFSNRELKGKQGP